MSGGVQNENGRAIMFDPDSGERTDLGPFDDWLRRLNERADFNERQSRPEYQRALEDARADLRNTPYGFVENMADTFTLGLQGPFNGAMAAIGQGAQNLAGETEYSAGNAYDAARQAWNERRREFQEERPAQSIVSSILGGFAAPGSQQIGRFVAGARGGTGLLNSGRLLPVTARSAATGAGVGAGYGLTTSDPGDELRNSAEGGFMGGLFGGLTPPALAGGSEVLRRGASALSETADQVSRAVRGLDVSDAAPARSTQNVFERTLGLQTPAERGAERGRQYLSDMADWARVTPEQLRSADPRLTAAEAMGPNAIAQAGAIARRAGQTPQIADDLLSLRQFQRPDRIVDRISDAVGMDPRMAREGVEALVTQGREDVNPLFQAVRDQDTPVMTDRLREIMQRPDAQRVLGRVYRDLQNQGVDPVSVGFAPLREPFGQVTEYRLEAPNARTWDLFRQTIGREVERNPLTGRPLPDTQSAGNFGLNQITRDVTEELRRVVPGYGEALDRSGDYLSLNSAFERSGGLLTRPSREFNQVWGGLRTDAERQAAQARVLSDINDMARAGRLRPSMFRTSQDIRDNLSTAFGPERAQRIVDDMAGLTPSSEARMAAAESRMRPNLNSTTGDMIENQSQTGDAIVSLGRAGMQAARGNAGGAAQSIFSAINSPIRGARTPLPMASRDEAGRLLYSSPQAMADMLEELRRTPRRVMSGLFAPTIPRLAGSR